MKTKQIISITLVALLLITVLLGCQPPAPTPTETPTTEPTASPTTEPTTVPTTEPIVETTDPTTEPSEDATVPTEETTIPTEPMHEHDFKAGKTVSPTCTEGGYTVYECECGEYYNDDETAKRGHNYKADHDVEATCDKRGYTVYECTRCGNSYEDDYTTAKGHDYSSKVVAPTTKAQGYTKYTCEVCGNSYRDNYTAKLPTETEPTTQPTKPSTEPTTEPTTQPTEHSHSYKVTETVDATCTMGGYKVYTCSCGDSYTGDKTDALNHSYKAEVVEPTTEAEGYTLYTCSRCGDSYKDNYTEKLPEPTGHQHNFVVQKVQEPTCLDMGFTFLLCDCGEEAFEDIKDALGHNFSSGATCSRCGYSEESTVKLDYAAAIAYGNQYAANTYGWIIDLSLNAGNAGYQFPDSASVEGVLSKGGQSYLNYLVAQNVDSLYEYRKSYGNEHPCGVNCDVYEYRDGGILIYVYYG